MKEFDCEYMSGGGDGKSITILAETKEEAYAEFIKQNEPEPYAVY